VIRITFPSVDAHRTPDELFEGLPDFPWEPVYREWDGLRLAHLDEGDGPPLLLLHGEPTWSFLWRKVIPPLLEAGYRCVVPDLPGFGRSDKPTDDSWYSFDRYTAAVSDLVRDLDLTGATAVVHDWGGPIGLYVASVAERDRFDRLVAMNTGVFNGHQRMSDDWHRFADFVAANHDLPIEPLIGGATSTDLSEAVMRGYTAPFDTPEAKAGARSFPLLIPTSPDAPGAVEGQQTMDVLIADDRPSLLLWGVDDPALPLDPVGRAVQLLFPQADPLTPIEGASHFLQEDRGEETGRLIADWLSG
jgi:haloalkane dehalogenase